MITLSIVLGVVFLLALFLYVVFEGCDDGFKLLSVGLLVLILTSAIGTQVSELSNLKNSYATLQAQNSELQDANSELSSKNSYLRVKVEVINSKFEVADSANEALTKNLQEAHVVIKESKDRVEALGAKYAKLKAEKRVDAKQYKAMKAKYEEVKGVLQEIKGVTQ